MDDSNPLLLPPDDLAKFLSAPPAKDTAQPVSAKSDNPLLLPPDQLAATLSGKPSGAATSVAPSSAAILQTPKGEPKDLSWEDVGQQAIKNLGPSAYEFGHSIYQTVAHPLDTASAIGSLGTGAYSKAKTALGYQPTAEEKKSEASVDALTDFYKRRYGSMAGFKEAIASDPIGVLSDLTIPFTGGTSGGVKATSLAGKAGEAAQGIARAVDPLNVVSQIPEKAARAVTTVGNVPLSAASGVSYRTLQQAAKDGLTDNPLFWQHATGAAPATDVVSAIQNEFKNIAKEGHDDYVRGMTKAQAEDAGKVLDYSKVDDALAQNRQMISPNGLTFNPESPSVKLQTQLENLVDNWKNNPNNAHTMFQFDQLKQGIRNLGYERTEKGSFDRKLIDNAAEAAKNTITNPTYRDTMERYSKFANNMNDLNRDLMSGRSTGAQIRSVVRNMDTSHKGQLLDQVIQRNPDIASMLAGQEIANAKPSRLRELLPFGAAYAAGNPLPILAGLASAPTNAARISYYTGRLGGLPSYLYEKYPLESKAAYQAGRTADILSANQPPRQQASGGRISRATGGRTTAPFTAEGLIAAAERAKKANGNATESLLNQPDEAITRALAIANKHI